MLPRALVSAFAAPAARMIMLGKSDLVALAQGPTSTFGTRVAPPVGDDLYELFRRIEDVPARWSRQSKAPH
jgi:hypothetical protein